jgi:hypothetical protein
MIFYEVIRFVGLVLGFCEEGNEPSGSVKYWGILEKVAYCGLLKKSSA